MTKSSTTARTTLTNEDYAIVGRNVRRGISVSDHHDSIDYRAMLARELEGMKPGARFSTNTIVCAELHYGRSHREMTEKTIGHAISADDLQRYNYRNVVG